MLCDQITVLFLSSPHLTFPSVDPHLPFLPPTFPSSHPTFPSSPLPSSTHLPLPLWPESIGQRTTVPFPPPPPFMSYTFPIIFMDPSSLPPLIHVIHCFSFSTLMDPFPLFSHIYNIHTHTHLSPYSPTYITYTHTHLSPYSPTYITHTHTHIFTYTCTHTHTYLYIHAHIYTHQNPEAVETTPLMYADALWDHVGIKPDELSFKVGNVIAILDMTDEQMWHGSIGEKNGWFLASFVRVRKSG